MVTSTGKIALWGAAGAVGKAVAGALDAEGLSHRVVGRNRKSLSAAFGQGLGAEIITLSEEDPASARAARGVETPVYLVGVPYDQFRLHPVVMRRTLAAAVAEGVKRVPLGGVRATSYEEWLRASLEAARD
jgi:uncharacterized protein YbjT (DUF2867 family)